MLTEEGLYEVLFQSRKPIAKLFKKGVKTILKEIRTKGGYIASRVEDTDEEIMARALLVADATIKRKDERIAQLQAEKRPRISKSRSSSRKSSRTRRKSFSPMPSPPPSGHASLQSSRRFSSRTESTSDRTGSTGGCGATATSAHADSITTSQRRNR